MSRGVKKKEPAREETPALYEPGEAREEHIVYRIVNILRSKGLEAEYSPRFNVIYVDIPIDYVKRIEYHKGHITVDLGDLVIGSDEWRGKIIYTTVEKNKVVTNEEELNNITTNISLDLNRGKLHVGIYLPDYLAPPGVVPAFY